VAVALLMPRETPAMMRRARSACGRWALIRPAPMGVVHAAPYLSAGMPGRVVECGNKCVCAVWENITLVIMNRS